MNFKVDIDSHVMMVVWDPSEQNLHLEEYFFEMLIYFWLILKAWETCVSNLWLGKYMVMESYVNEIWDFPING